VFSFSLPRELYLPQHECNAQLKIQIKWQAARTGISPTSWPPCEEKQTHVTQKVKNILRDAGNTQQ